MAPFKTMDTSTVIRTAIVGCGRISEKHFEAIHRHSENMKLVAVCDTDSVALKSTSHKYDVPGYPNLDSLLDQTNADLIVLATPSGLHAKQTIRCAQAGKHVISEKPMATRWEEGKRMVEACDSAGVRLFVVKQNRFNSTLCLLKKAVIEKRFGRIFLVNVNVFWTRPQSYYDQAAWRGTWEFDGGAFMNQASHYVDLLDWLIGPVESVQAYTATLARQIEVEDTGVANLRWRSGTLGSINVTMLTYPQNLEGSITIIGEKGTVKVGGIAVNEIQHWQFADKRKEDELVQNSNYNITNVYGFGHTAYYENVIGTLRGTQEPSTCGTEGLKSLELLIALYMSASSNKRISLPLDS